MDNIPISWLTNLAHADREMIHTHDVLTPAILLALAMLLMLAVYLHLQFTRICDFTMA